ncbi:MAG TPA: PhoH family protein [Terriglobales bacterium]|jgi:phosphate starvation-inducible PhoH-like protein
MKTSFEFSPGIETLFGPLDENLRLLEKQLQVEVRLGPSAIEAEGSPESLTRLEQIILDYQALHAEGFAFAHGDLRSLLQVVLEDPATTLGSLARSGRQRSFGKKSVQPKTVNQRRYLDAIERQDMVFGIGPAGTGKTYLAVAMAVAALNGKQVSRIVLARPAVEAGERLGFLPGTLQEKVDPYLRPLYDALFDLMEPDRVERLLERNIIEIAPLAFMRGRTLNDAFIILDEAQNSTQEQMKMFLTRMGFHSKAVITGDVTQIDLPQGRRSGLLQATDVLDTVEGISVVYFDEKDVVRHPLVQRIVRAYQEFDARTANRQLELLPQENPSEG